MTLGRPCDWDEALSAFVEMHVQDVVPGVVTGRLGVSDRSGQWLLALLSKYWAIARQGM